ncbi:MAG: enoyl-CoA hydratase/isomerase family protein [Hyphomonadaceae bacterium]|nr:enoyl-CoA hydratase/isomerase family protein [Hyphomonadaceae bacterium]
MSSDHIHVSRDAGVLELRFNRPEKKNAITNAMYGALADAIFAAADDGDVRAILFTAAGDFFSAGNDISDFAATASGAIVAEPRHVGRFLEACVRAEKPLVAAVQGHAVGIGVTMLFQCDLVYVAETARLTTPFIDLGLVPENASSITMPARMGHAHAFAMLGLGEPLMGRDAVAAGLANAALPEADVEARARAAAYALAKKPAEALRITKALMRDRPTLMARMQEESALFAERLQSAEARAAFAAFLSRR